MKLFNKKGQQGFTIIEVMIVLAVAGLIIGVVLVAIPQLQRNQRNSARKSVLSRIKTEIDNFSGNNSGKVPAASVASGASNLGAPNVALGFFTRYLGCTGAANPTCTVNIADPKSGFVVGMGTNGNTQTIAVANNAVATPNAVPASLTR
jgi:prepilin-type N-terminal cleavage/methylation domain-containing protein